MKARLTKACTPRHPGPPLPPRRRCADLPQALIAASAGFCAYVLWAEVSGRLYRASRTAPYRHMLHFTVLLVLFSAAAY